MTASRKLSPDKAYREYLKGADRQGYSVNEYYGRIEKGWLWIEDMQETIPGTDEFSQALEYMTTLEVMSLENDIYLSGFLAGGSEDIKLDIRMHLRAERRGKLIHWYAYKDSIAGLRKLYAGHSEDITIWRIVELAKRFEGWTRKF